MSNGLVSLCDDFYLDLCVNTQLDLPTGRDTVLSFFERMQKKYPTMGNLIRRSENEYCLQEDQSSGCYRWVAMETDRLGSGMVNPLQFVDAYEQHKLVIELAPYMLSLSHLDIGSLDLTFAMDFECPDNHDDVISEAVFSTSAFSTLMELPNVKPIGISPVAVLSLSEDNYTQARISIESKTSVYDPRKAKEATDQAISLSLTVRQYPHADAKFDPLASFDNQCRVAEELMSEKIVPNFVRPLLNVIAQRRLG